MMPTCSRPRMPSSLRSPPRGTGCMRSSAQWVYEPVLADDRCHLLEHYPYVSIACVFRFVDVSPNLSLLVALFATLLCRVMSAKAAVHHERMVQATHFSPFSPTPTRSRATAEPMSAQPESPCNALRLSSLSVREKVREAYRDAQMLLLLTAQSFLCLPGAHAHFRGRHANAHPTDALHRQVHR